MPRDEQTLTVVRLWKYAAEIRKATAAGSDLPSRALRYCGPAVHAASCGYWLYPPFDVDVMLTSKGSWRWQLRDDVTESPPMGRPLMVFGLAEPDVFQVFSGLVFCSPPGYAVWLRPPANCSQALPVRVGDCIIEDWLTIPIFFNLKVLRRDKWCEIRRSTVIAQVVVIPQAVYTLPTHLEIDEVLPTRVTEFVREYDADKFASFPKNSKCYFRARALQRVAAAPIGEQGTEARGTSREE
jgi:hypothetical protein